MAERNMPGGIRIVMGSKLGKVFQDANVWLYRKTGGRLGGRMKGAPLLLLTTRGRKSGKSRTTPLIYLEDGAELAVVASKGGWPEHPLWYRNLQATPEVQVEIGRDVRALSSRTANAEERQRLWPRLVALYSEYADYQSWSDREIPVVLLGPRH
jgi:deazaflavin-dependent oxidoreductase (nitroreductase family)